MTAALVFQPGHDIKSDQSDIYRKPFQDYYSNAVIPTHDPAEADDLGLKWQLPLLKEDLGGLKTIDLGGAWCPTMVGRERGPWGSRYHGIHRGHDMGVPIKKLKGEKFPVRAVADGVYDGRRTYTHADPLPKACRPLVVYHKSKSGGEGTYTSIYCHVDPLPKLKVGQQLKVGDQIGTLEDPEGSWSAHVHLEIYTRRVYSSKDSSKFSRCGCKNDKACDELVRKNDEIPRGCGIFEDDLFLMEPVLFIHNSQQ